MSKQIRRLAALLGTLCVLGGCNTGTTPIDTEQGDTSTMVTTQEVSAPLPEENRYFYLSSPDNTACRISFTGNHGWRVQTATDGVYDDVGAGQLLSRMLEEDDPSQIARIDASEADGKTTVRAEDGSYLLYIAEPFSLAFYTAEGSLAAHVTDIRVTDGVGTVQGELFPDEAIFGTGERFNTLNQRGKRLDMYAKDLWDAAEGNSYVPIPLLLSSRGSGLYMNRYERMTIDLGNAFSDVWSIEIPDAPLDLYVFATDSSADVLYGYSALTGFSEMPQDWNFGYTICRYNPEFSTSESIMTMVRKMEEHDLPWTSIILEAWDVSQTFRYDDLKETVDYLHSIGKKVLTYTPAGQMNLNNVAMPSYDYLVLDENGYWKVPTYDSHNPDSRQSTAVFLNITNEGGYNWYFDTFWGNLVWNIGFDGIKIDFCERFADIGVTYQFSEEYPINGSHHWYPTLVATYFGKNYRERTDGFMNFTRGGGIGSQRMPMMWAGDQTRQFSRLQWQLNAILSAGMSGIPFMSCDMAGYTASDYVSATEEARIFQRGTEMCCFSINMETHGSLTRPYDYPDDTVDVLRAYLNLHYALTPYLSEMSRIACDTAMPVMRHLFLMYPDDKTALTISDEYMLGDALLVAPVLTDTTKRSVYLPEGNWKNIFTGESYTAGEDGLWLKDIDVPLSSIPVFLNQNHNSETIESVLADASEVIKTICNLSR